MGVRIHEARSILASMKIETVADSYDFMNQTNNLASSLNLFIIEKVNYSVRPETSAGREIHLYII